MTYDDRQLFARLVTWLCCRRTVYATDPNRGCLVCHDVGVQQTQKVIAFLLQRGWEVYQPPKRDS